MELACYHHKLNMYKLTQDLHERLRKSQNRVHAEPSSQSPIQK